MSRITYDRPLVVHHSAPSQAAGYLFDVSGMVQVGKDDGSMCHLGVPDERPMLEQVLSGGCLGTLAGCDAYKSQKGLCGEGHGGTCAGVVTKMPSRVTDPFSESLAVRVACQIDLKNTKPWKEDTGDTPAAIASQISEPV